MTVVVILIEFEKMSMFQFYKIFHPPLSQWPWMKVTETGIASKAYLKSAFLKSFMTPVVIEFEKMPMFDFLKHFPSAPVTVTFDEGQSNWYGLNGLATKYHCTKFHDCSAHGVWENVHVWVVQDFPSTPVTVTLDEGHRHWLGLQGLATKCLFATFHDCSCHRVWENVNVKVFHDFSISPCDSDLGRRPQKMEWPKRPRHNVSFCQVSWLQCS